MCPRGRRQRRPGRARRGREAPRPRRDVNTLVVGGAGFLGSHLAERLLAEGHAVDVVDDLRSGSLANLA
ncbi:MAG: NAD-dependent epimerase/dehydratase family protein, partial [Ilumatobacter sp.]|nr:NAD-dependent epimerase/dehydratase family protein [Ilumatobacter sp.]